MKPGDVYLGVIDFFSTLVPGGIAVFLVLASDQHALLGGSPFESTKSWTALSLLAYVLGHLIAAVGSAVLDPFYDRIYSSWRRTTVKFVKSKPPLSFSRNHSRWSVIGARLKHVLKQRDPDDGLLAAAKVLKRQQLDEVARAAGLSSEQITNTFWWAGTVVRLKSVDGAAEIEALSAQSKLFRSLAVILVLTALWPGLPSFAPAWAWTALLLLSIWRFMSLRWGATERTYEYFIAVSIESSNKATGSSDV